MILLKRDGSRWSVNCYPTVMEVMVELMHEYNKAMFLIEQQIKTEQKHYAEIKSGGLRLSSRFVATEPQA